MKKICCVSLWTVWNVFDQTSSPRIGNFKATKHALCVYICNTVYLRCIYMWRLYICGTIVYLSKANRFLFLWAGSCFVSPGAGIPQGRGKVWKSEGVGASSNSRPLQEEVLIILPSKYDRGQLPPCPSPLGSDVPGHGKYNLRTEATK